jgi:hypothetical protein
VGGGRWEGGTLGWVARTMAHHKPLVDSSNLVHLLIAELKVDVRLPGLLVRMPLHPPLKDLSSVDHVAQHLFHVRVSADVWGRW